MSREPTQLSLIQQGLVLIAVPLMFELLLLGALAWLWSEAERETEAAERSKTIIAQTNTLVQHFFDVGFAFIAFDAKNSSGFLQEHFEKKMNALPKAVKSLKEQVRANPEHLAILSKIEGETDEAIKWLKDAARRSQEGEKLNVMAALSMRQQLNRIVLNLDKIIIDEKAKQGNKPKEAERLKGLVKGLLIFGVGMSIALALLLVSIFHRSTVKRLDFLLNNSIKLGRGEALAPALQGKDEIAIIDRVFHEAAVALAEAAARERAVIDNAVDVICSIDSHGRFKKISPAAQRLWGYEPDELVERIWTELIFENDRERSVKWMEELQSAKQSGEFENRIIRKDKTLVEMLWSAHWSDSEQALFCVVHDVTDRHELDRLKQQFVAMISHDLRTPLNAVQSTLTLLERNAWGELTPHGKAKVTAAEANLKHSIDLINNLLDLDKMESGTMDLQRSDIYLSGLIQKCADAVSALADQRSIEIKIEVPENIDELTVYAEERRLSQVLINLLGNALKFSEHDSEVSIKVSEEGSVIKIAVQDHGPGITETQRNLIFERFHQVPASGKEKEGTGLGLAICKAIVEAHGGTIGVDSTVGEGSTFWFKLPKSKET